MSKIKLDLSKVKHVKSDDKSTTLQHKDGHMITLLHKALSPENQKQLSALNKMADGGVLDSIRRSGWAGDAAKETQKIDDAKANPRSTNIPNSGSAGPTQARPGYTKGGGVGPRWDSYQGPKPADPSEFIDKPTTDKTTPEQDKERHKKQDEEDAAHRKANPAPAEPKEEGYTNYAEGGAANNTGLPCRNPNCKSHGKPHPNCRCYSAMADGGEVSPVCKTKSKHYPDCQYYAEGTPEVEEKSGRGPRHEYIKPDQEETEEHKNKSYDRELADAEPAMQQASSGSRGASGSWDPNQDDNANATAIDDGQTNEAMASKINGPDTYGHPNSAQPQPPQAAPQGPQEPPEQQEPPLSQPGTGEQSSNPVERFAAVKGINEKQYHDEDQAWAQDLANGHVTPETYQSLFAKKDTLGKIGTLFGLLISGAGSGLAHQPNAVLQMMNQTIANDLEAQKSSKQNAVNYLRLSQQHEMQKASINSLNAQTALAGNTHAQIKANRSALQYLIENANALPKGSQEQQKAFANIAMLNQYVQDNNNRLIDRAATAGAVLNMGQDQNGSEQAFQNRQKALNMSGDQNKNIAGFESDRHIPGVPGSASRPIPQEARDKIQAMDLLDNKVKDVLDYAQKHKGSIDPQVLKTARQKAEELTSFYNKSVDSLGMTQGRLGWLEEQIKKDPTSLIQQLLGNNATLREIQNSNSNRRLLQLKQLGFPIEQQSSRTINVIKPDGTKGSIPEANLQKALKLGYKQQ
jgi:hypothetical protein